MKLLVSVFLLIGLNNSYAQPGQNVSNDDRMKWWRDAKFGMFIHWGVYAVPAGTYKGKQIEGIGEWIMNIGKIPVAEYKAYAKQFNPVKYNADAWVETAKGAGMKYIIITSKHHDGFALFDSKVTDWDITDASPYGKDLLKPLVAACRRQGIKIGFYYSHAQDWNHPGGATKGEHWDKAQDGSMDDYLEKIAIPQVKEILTNYGEIDVLWWDTPKDMTPERAEKLNRLAKQYPKLITNNRLGGGYKGDTETPEQFIPATGFNGRCWETCMTMNDTWGYKSYDNNWKSVRTLIRNLTDIVSKEGNFLLNVGPTAAGEFPAASIDRLSSMGEWLKINGESIYGTTASPFPYLPWGRATRKGQKLYLHVFDYPAGGQLQVPMDNTITRAYLLSRPGEKCKVRQESGHSIIYLPEKAPDSINSVVVVEFTGTPGVSGSAKINELTSVEKKAGWKLLFDGKSLKQWRGYYKEDPSDHWHVEDGSIVMERKQVKASEDLITKQEFENFELMIDWKISEAGNSGIMFHVSNDKAYKYASETGPEMQILDDEKHPDGKKGTAGLYRAGTNYGLMAVPAQVVKPVGQYNTVRLVVKNGHVEHWLNGIKLLEYDLLSSAWEALVKNTKFAKMPDYGRMKKGHIALQDHGDKVWFRNIKIRAL